eukprot:2036472-Pleurochrysis_carterae.AAC.1
MIAKEVANVPALAPMDAAQIKLLQEYRASLHVNERRAGVPLDAEVTTKTVKTEVDVDVEDAGAHRLNSEQASVVSSSGVAGQLPAQESVQPDVDSHARLVDEDFCDFPAHSISTRLVTSLTTLVTLVTRNGSS